MSKKQSTIKMSLDPTYNEISMSDLVVHSHDKNSYQLNFEFSDGRDNPLPLKDAKPRILFVLDNDIMQLYQLKIDSENLGEASFTFVEPLLHYEGIASAYVYVDYEDKKHDVGGFMLKFKKSAIDEEMPEIEFYVQDFDEALKICKDKEAEIDELSEKIEDRMNLIDKKIELNDLVTHHEFNPVKDNYFYESPWLRKQQKPSLTIIDDDGENTFYHKYKPLMEKYKVGFTSALIGSRGFGGQFLSKSQIRELRDLGAEFVSHGWYHDTNKRPYQMTEKELDDDLRRAKEFIRSVGGNDEAYVVPFGTNTPMNRKVAMRYYRANILTTRPSEEDKEGVVNTIPVDNFMLSRVSIESDMTYIKKQVDKAIEENGWLIIMSHVNGPGSADERVRKLDELLSYAKSKSVDYVNIAEGLNRFGQISRYTDESGIYADGTAYGDLKKETDFNHMRDFNLSTSLLDFEFGRVTAFKINNVEAKEIGLQRGGVVYTFRDKETTYSHQIYVPIDGTNKLYIRYFSSSEKKWGKFISLNDFNIENSASTFRLNAPITDFDVNKFTVTKVTNADASTFGLPSGGTVIVYRASEDFYSYQEFIQGRGDNRLLRFWENGKWSEWTSTKPKFLEYSRTLSARKIQANSTVDLITGVSNMKSTDVMILNPITDMSSIGGVFWSAFTTPKGQYVIRLANVTNDSIDIPDISFHIKRVQ